MTTAVVSLALVLLSVCSDVAWGAAGDKLKCVYSNKAGRIETFFSSGELNKVSILPCKYNMAKLKCGSVRVEVSAENQLDANDHTLRINVVSVRLTTNVAGVKYTQVNTASLQMIEKFVKRGKLEDQLWGWQVEGEKPAQEHRILGYYDAARESAYIRNGSLRVDFKPKADSISISCDATDFSAATRFPRTVCGSTENSAEDAANLLALPHAGSEVKQLTSDQRTDVCKATVSVLSAKCGKEGDTLPMCYMLYSPFARNVYQGCLKDESIDPFKVYLSCLRMMCPKDKTSVSADDCSTIKRVLNKCGEKQNAPATLNSLLVDAGCEGVTAAPTPVSGAR